MFEFIQHCDEWLFRFLNQTLSNSIADAVCPLFNHAAPFLPILILILGWIAYRDPPKIWPVILLLLAGLLIGDALIYNPLKHFIARARPAVILEGVRGLASGATGGFSFPSSHTAIAFQVAAMMYYFFRRKVWIWISLASLIGFSRVYVGVHYPSDVIGSALLGWFIGRGFTFFVQLFYPAIKTRASENKEISSTKSHLFKTLFTSPLFPWVILVTIQLLRLWWVATTPLDIPPICAQIWRDTIDPQKSSLLTFCAKIWFLLFGSSSFSLWAIPWFLQTVWLGILAFLAWRRGGISHFWIIIIFAATLPLISELSFLGSPSQVFEDADWGAPLFIQAFYLYLILGLPLWIASLAHLRSYPWSCGIALAGLFFLTTLPHLPWLFLAIIASPALLALAKEYNGNLEYFRKKEAGLTRFFLVVLSAYSILASLCVYNPRLLRKLDISLLPRNNPHYVQMGWRKWIERIKPKIEASRIHEIWVDSELSHVQVQYLLGREYQVRDLQDLQKTGYSISNNGVLYIREIYFSQINPFVIFTPRTKNLPFIASHLKELDSYDHFYKGDPIRQFTLYQIVLPQNLK